MRPLDQLGDETRELRGLLFDLDDTVLTHGVLTRAAYEAIWDLHEAGFGLVAVTGRPSGWAEVIARQWPVDGVVAENGAVFVVREGAGVQVLFDGPEPEVRDRRERLDRLVAEVAVAMPDLGLADDVRARRSDVAWDIGERVTVAPERVEELARRVVAAGARTTRSTVHLHASFERDDKASGATRFLRDHRGEDPGSALALWAFVGDSPNDRACFSAFRLTFGVANVTRYTSAFAVPPRWVTHAARGEGFAELARTLVAKRHQNR